MMIGVLADEFGLAALRQWGSPEAERVSHKKQAGLSLARACTALGVARAEIYRWTGDAVDEAEMSLRHAMQEIALDMPSYGYRRIHQSLLRLGFTVNHKRVQRLMREDNLLCLRRRKFVVHTTDSNHEFPIYPNLTRDLEVTGLNQLWVADITYVRLSREFVFLAVLLDMFSRRCIGWVLAHHLRAELPLAALKMALRDRAIQPGQNQVIHHSDRGTQYASSLYSTPGCSTSMVFASV